MVNIDTGRKFILNMEPIPQDEDDRTKAEGKLFLLLILLINNKKRESECIFLSSDRAIV